MAAGLEFEQVMGKFWPSWAHHLLPCARAGAACHPTHTSKRTRERRKVLAARAFIFICACWCESAVPAAQPAYRWCISTIGFHFGRWRKLVEPPAVSKFVGIKKSATPEPKWLSLCVWFCFIASSQQPHTSISPFSYSPIKKFARARTAIYWLGRLLWNSVCQVTFELVWASGGSFARAAFGWWCFNAHVLWQLASRVWLLLPPAAEC
jgi:hypothetical protein